MKNLPVPNRNLRAYRAVHGLTLRQLSQRLGTGFNHHRLHRFENGQSIPSEDLPLLAKALNVPIEKMYTDPFVTPPKRFY